MASKLSDIFQQFGFLIAMGVVLLVSVVTPLVAMNTVSAADIDGAIAQRNLEVADCKRGDNGLGGGTAFGRPAPILPDSSANREFLDWKCEEIHPTDMAISQLKVRKAFAWGVGAFIVSTLVVSIGAVAIEAYTGKHILRPF